VNNLEFVEVGHTARDFGELALQVNQGR
jgi:hypothetical protein